MVRNAYILRRFEHGEIKKEKMRFSRALKMVDAMWKEALRLGAIKKTKGSEGLDKVIRIAKLINAIQ